MNLFPTVKVKMLREALHAKAKGSPNYRFYTLYDKVYRRDVLGFAYACCQANGGAAGVDGQTFADIEEYRYERWVEELAEELRRKTYRPQPVRRVWIPKPDGKQRPLGIPTIRDRVVQMAAVVILEPIFEADLQPEQYAYRSERSALDAVRAVHALVNRGHTEVVDADLRRRSGQSARGADLTAARQYLYASAGMEGVGPRAASRRVHRQLRGRLSAAVPSWSTPRTTGPRPFISASASSHPRPIPSASFCS